MALLWSAINITPMLNSVKAIKNDRATQSMQLLVWGVYLTQPFQYLTARKAGRDAPTSCTISPQPPTQDPALPCHLVSVVIFFFGKCCGQENILLAWPW